LKKKKGKEVGSRKQNAKWFEKDSPTKKAWVSQKEEVVAYFRRRKNVGAQGCS